MATDPTNDFRAVQVSADALYRLTPLLSRRQDCAIRLNGFQHLWGWRVEPCAAGGVLVIATNGKAIGVIHDPKGRASHPATILASKSLRRAVKPPKPRTVYVPGDWDLVELPDQFQPELVIATSLFVSVIDRAHVNRDGNEEGGEEDETSLHTEGAEFGDFWTGGYRLVEEFVPWRRVFAPWEPTVLVPAAQRLSPKLFSAFRRFERDTLEIHTPADPNFPVLVQSLDHPGFVGAIMRGDMNRQVPPPPALPEWLAPATTPAEAEA